jgi:hypothetical protein
MSRLQNASNAEALQGSMKNNNGGIKLPFPAPILWWKNGNPELADTEEITDARRFGGWGISKEDVDEQLPNTVLPANWKYFEALRNNEGKTYSAFLARSAWVAPIDRRYTWVTFEGKSSSKVNYLCYLAVRGKDKNELMPWGAVVLTASSYSGKALDDAMAKFKSETATLRGDDPVNLFYIPLGTFGNTPKIEKRTGKGGKSSPIFPCQLWTPDSGFASTTLDEWFVGDEIAAEMGLLRIQAKDWLTEWNDKKQEAKPEVQAPEVPDFMQD